MLAAGLAKRALVVGGDVLSKILDWTDRSTLVLFGDGAGAVVLEHVDERRLPRLRARRRRRRRRAPLAAGQRLAARSRTPDKLREDERPRGVQVRHARARLVGREGARASAGCTVEDVDVYVPHQANMRIIDHAAREARASRRRRSWSTSTATAILPPDRSRSRSPTRAADGRLQRGGAGVDDGHGSRAHVGLGADGMDEGEGGLTKIAFMLPGPGLARGRHGPRDRRGRARGDGGVRARQRGGRHRPEAALLRGAGRGASSTRRCSSRRSSRRASRSTQAIRARGIEPDYVVGHSVGEFAALGAAESLGVAEAIALVRERGLAMAEAAQQHPGSMAAILGLDGRGRRDALPQDPQRLAGELQLPGPDRRLGRGRRGRRVLRARPSRRARAARCKLRVSGAFHSPARRPRRRPAAAGGRARSTSPSRRRAFMSTVTAKLEPAQRLWRRCSSSSSPRRSASRRRRASSIGKGVHDVRRGRPRQRPQRFTEADRPQRARRSRSATSASSTSSKRRLPDADASRRLEGKTALVTGASRGIGRAIAAELARGRRGGRRSATARAGRGGGARGRDRRPRRAGRRLRPRARRGGSSRRRATSTSSSTTPA